METRGIQEAWVNSENPQTENTTHFPTSGHPAAPPELIPDISQGTSITATEVDILSSLAASGLNITSTPTTASSGDALSALVKQGPLQESSTPKIVIHLCLGPVFEDRQTYSRVPLRRMSSPRYVLREKICDDCEGLRFDCEVTRLSNPYDFGSSAHIKPMFWEVKPLPSL